MKTWKFDSMLSYVNMKFENLWKKVNIEKIEFKVLKLHFYSKNFLYLQKYFRQQYNDGFLNQFSSLNMILKFI